MKIKIPHIIKFLGKVGAEMLLPETLKAHHKYQFEFYYLYFYLGKINWLKLYRDQKKSILN